ncbi:MAG: phosphatidylinositol-specific phospholipase C1-like protein [Planctomycetota bacterium]
MLRRVVLLLVLLGVGLALAAPAAGRGSGKPPKHHVDRACKGHARALSAVEQAVSRRAGRLFRPRPRGLQRIASRLATRYADECVGINETQVLGSHNSYHIEPRWDVLRLVTAFVPEAIAWKYTHLRLDEQFGSQGIRQIELDVFADPEGGLYAERQVLRVLQEDPASGIPALDEPGIKVLHVQEVDYRTTCHTLVQCLTKVKRWSDQNPGHLPLMILIEAKDEMIPDPLPLGFAEPIPFGTEEFRDLDGEILSVFPRSQILLPDDVRGGDDTLEAAVLSRGWPRLGAARGRVLFALDNGGEKRLEYQDGRTALEGRVLFTNSFPGEDDAAFVKLNDPIGDAALIPELVRAGYLVRTRADADTEQARTGDTTRRDAAIESGAQFVSTDYPVPDPRFSDYFVAIPGGMPGRCNPINAPPGCRSEALEP